MANIPYGYRIENGAAVPDTVKAEKLNRFISMLLSGTSFNNAKKESGVELSAPALRVYLRKGTYQGTEYYPAIVPAGTHEMVLAELESRTQKGVRKLPDDLPVRYRFRMERPEGPCGGNASDVAALLYSLIVPDENGRECILPGELRMIKEWACK